MSSSNTRITVAATVATVGLLGAILWALAARDSASSTTPAAEPGAPAIAKNFDPAASRAMRKALQQRVGKRMPLEVPEQFKAKAAIPLPGPDMTWDAWLLSAMGKAAGGAEEERDALGAAGPRVDLKASGRVWARADIDLDRDGNWDEQWAFVDNQLERRRSVNDDGTYAKPLLFVAGVWTQSPADALPGKKTADGEAKD
jgi:hypothetical protein